LSSKLRFGILGCGVIGPFHARAIAALPDHAELVAVADHHSDRAAKLAQEYRAAWYDNIQSLLAHPGLDVVCICTPSGRHAEHAIAALHAGKHVVVEKPIDITLPAIDQLLAVQRASDCKVTVISQHRFDPATRIVADAVQSGRFGRLTLGTAQVRW
jgi:UDP-N-acetyl-2-amino-2-deoxyglucuronate dehydrogenase